MRDKWVVNVNGYNLYDEFYETKEEAMKRGLELAKDKGLNGFYIGKRVDFIPHINAADIISNIEDDIFNFGDYYGCDYLDDISSKEYSELENDLNNTFMKWAKRNKKETKIYCVIDEEIIKVKDYK